MFKLMHKARKNQKGFTLVELMVVVVIIGILIAIAVPIFGQVTRNAANRAHEANIRTLAGAASMHIADVGRGTASAGTFTGTVLATNPLLHYVQVWPTVPTDALGAVPEGFPVAVTGAATTEAQTYSVVIATDGGINVHIIAATL